MPDWCHLTPPPLRPTQHSHRPQHCHPRFDPRVHKLRALIADLAACHQGLVALAAELPIAGERFAWLAEVRSAVECVHSDLLDDAVGTLQHVIEAKEIELRSEFLARQNILND